MMAKRLATIRRGIRYQDLVAADSLLKMLSPDDPPLSVNLEDIKGGKFDDVVERYSNRIVWQQVKWAEHPYSEPLKVRSLVARKGRGKSLLRGFADSFKKLQGSGLHFELHLITNRTFDSEMQKLFQGSPARIKAKLTKPQKTALKKLWLKETGFHLPPFYVPVVMRVFPKQGSPRAPLLRRCRRRSHSPAPPATIAAEQRERACCSRA